MVNYRKEKINFMQINSSQHNYSKQNLNRNQLGFGVVAKLPSCTARAIELNMPLSYVSIYPINLEESVITTGKDREKFEKEIQITRVLDGSLDEQNPIQKLAKKIPLTTKLVDILKPLGNELNQNGHQQPEIEGMFDKIKNDLKNSLTMFKNSQMTGKADTLENFMTEA